MVLEGLLQLKLISIKKVQGGALEESQLVACVAFKKTLSYAAFKMQSKKLRAPRLPFYMLRLS